MLVQARSIGKCLVTFRALEVVYISVGCSHVSLHMMLEITGITIFQTFDILTALRDFANDLIGP